MEPTRIYGRNPAAKTTAELSERGTSLSRLRASIRTGVGRDDLGSPPLAPAWERRSSRSQVTPGRHTQQTFLASIMRIGFATSLLHRPRATQNPPPRST